MMKAVRESTIMVIRNMKKKGGEVGIPPHRLLHHRAVSKSDICTDRIAAGPLRQRCYGRHKPAHPLTDQVGVEVDATEEAHVWEEQDGAGAVHQREEEHTDEEADGVGGAEDGN